MNNNASTDSTREIVTRQAGSLILALWHDGAAPDELGGFRHRYAYRIAETTRPGTAPHDGRDIHSAVGAYIDTTAAMGTLVTLLSAAADAYRYEMSHPGSAPENLNLFPAEVVEAAYTNSDELTMLALELENPTSLEEPEATPTAMVVTAVVPTAQEHDEDKPAWPPGRYYTVVSLQDKEGHAVMDTLQQVGADTVIEDLARRDGAERLDAALFNTEVYPEAPVYPGTQVAENGPYVLTYHPGTGDVHLLREFPTDVERPARWPDRYTGIPGPASTQPEASTAPRRHMTRPTGPQAVRPEPPRASMDDGLSL